MANDASKAPNPFDLRTIKSLIALMTQHDLSEIDLREGESRIRLRRGPGGTTMASITPPLAAAPPAPVPLASPASASEPAKSEKTLHLIKSPTPGTFYASPSPDAEPFARVGARVTPTTVVCLIEAMKIFNEITADCTGVITDILIENQQPVEYGQVLFKVDPAG